MTARAMVLAVAISTAQCSPDARTPMTQPVQVMEQAWGPFARQCTTTRISHYEPGRHLSPNEVAQTHTTCVGFSALYRGDGSVEVTASMNADNPGSNPIVSRILRSPSGASRTARKGESGLLAYGSDNPDVAATLARDIGLTQQQVVAQGQALRLPIRLRLTSPLDDVLICQPNGRTADHDRQVLILACKLERDAETPELQARVVLRGTQYVDIETGIRLSGVMSGSLDGRARPNAQSPWRPVNDQIIYTKETDFE